jgi:phosphoglycerate kinase
MRIVTDAPLKGKTVLMRVDFNVPINTTGKIGDTNRIVQTVPTIKYCLDQGAKVVLISHMGRPDGYDKKFSLASLVDEIQEIIGEEILFSDDPTVTGHKSREKLDELKASDDKRILLLENTRFRPEEEECDTLFSRELAYFGDLFVMDAFGCAHRAHASTYGVADYLRTYSGFLMANEVKYLWDAIKEPARPFTIILGGSKVSDKIGLINNILDKADNILVGGAMAFTLLKGINIDVGSSLVESDKLDLAASIVDEATQKKVSMLLPVDVIASDGNEETAAVYDIGGIPSDYKGFDIGPKTTEKFCEIIKKSKTVIFNGPMGMFERRIYADGTKAVIKAMMDSDAVTIVGGGDSAAAVKVFKLDGKLTHISTGGGASLEILEGKSLPGVEICNGERETLK